MAEASQKLLVTALSDALKSGAHSDLTITCGADTYNVHKVIVCGRADFFARALKFGGQESKDSKIDLPGDDPAIIKLLIHYLYVGEYEPYLPALGEKMQQVHSAVRTLDRSPAGCTYSYRFPHTCSRERCQSYPERRFVCPHHICGNEDFYDFAYKATNCQYRCSDYTCKLCEPNPLPAINGDAAQLMIHTKCYEVAEKYDMVGLKDLVKEKYRRVCQHFWDDPMFGTAAHHAFSTTPEEDKGLRSISSATISEHMELVEKPEIKALLTQFNGLALGILEAKTAQHGWGKKK